MRVLVLVIVVVTWESKANSSSTGNELQTGTELGNYAQIFLKSLTLLFEKYFIGCFCSF